MRQDQHWKIRQRRMESSMLEEQEDMGTSALPFLSILHLDPVYFLHWSGLPSKTWSWVCPLCTFTTSVGRSGFRYYILQSIFIHEQVFIEFQLLEYKILHLIIPTLSFSSFHHLDLSCIRRIHIKPAFRWLISFIKIL